ncbi:MAG: ABC transporter ATP-binding protein [Candidatus Korarchaeota archaeon]
MSVPVMDTSIVRVENVSHFYGEVKALNQVNLDLNHGRWALVGPNGAGKTTLVKILLGILKPTQGATYILGKNAREMGRNVLRYVGYVPEIEALPYDWTAIDFVSHLGHFSGMSKHDAFRRANEVLNYVGMGEMRLRKIGSLSQGNRQKVKIATALVHDPDLLVFDEPTSGLDPNSRESVLEIIKELGDEGKSTIVSTHIMSDVEKICDNVIFLFNGEVRGVVKTKEADKVVNRISIKTNMPDALSKALQEKGYVVTRSGPYVIVKGKNNDEIYTEILKLAKQLDASISKMGHALLGIEEYYLSLMGGEI